MTGLNAQTFNFELVSPERKVISEPATLAVIPGTEGYFGVLANHSPLIAALKAGVVEVHMPAEGTRRIFIAGGFADVTAASCTVLAEEAVNVNDLVQADIEQSLRNLDEDLAAAQTEAEKARLQRRIDLTRARLEAVTGHIAVR